jgi:hypothetical protein
MFLQYSTLREYVNHCAHTYSGACDLVCAKFRSLCAVLLNFVFYAHMRASQKKARVGRGRVLPGRTVSRAIYEGNGGTLLTCGTHNSRGHSVELCVPVAAFLGGLSCFPVIVI